MPLQFIVFGWCLLLGVVMTFHGADARWFASRRRFPRLSWTYKFTDPLSPIFLRVGPLLLLVGLVGLVISARIADG